jgi:anti-sigma28 factor (negative regulator of flagellin synthesis)
MKIDNPLSSQVSTGAASQTGGITPSQSGTTSRSRSDGSSDQVQLSNLSAALRDLSVEDPSRTADIQKIANSVNAGTYQINPAELGQRILGESIESA